MIKKIARWFILGGTLFFVAKALKDNWSEVATVRIDPAGWAILAIATGVTLLAHIWAGWVWTWLLRSFNQSIDTGDFVTVYLKTNIAKYLPGNVWHHYGRIVAAKDANIPVSVATLSVVLEPLLLVAAALIIAVLFGSQLAFSQNNYLVWLLQGCGLIAVLVGIHPFFLNRLVALARKAKNRQNKHQSIPNPDDSLATNSTSEQNRIERYPIRPLLGELGFLLLRGSGFILTIVAIAPLQWQQIPLLLGTFSVSWLLGLITPGAPGGIGVFETTAIILLQHQFPPVLVITSVGLYRLISIVAEALGAGLATLEQHLFHNKSF